MKQIIKKLIIFSLSTLILLCTTGCKDSISASDIPYYTYKTEQSIDKQAKTYNFVFFGDEFNADLQLLKDELSAIPDTIPENGTKEVIANINSIKNDCFALIENYIELDKILVAYNNEIEPFRLAYETSMAKGEELYAEFLNNYPDYYKGTESQYLAERKAYTDKIASLKTSFEINKKYWPESANAMGMSYSAYVTYITNRHNNQIRQYQEPLDYLDYQWEARELIDNLLAALARIETNYDNQCVTIEIKYNDDYQKYYNAILQIVEKY